MLFSNSHFIQIFDRLQKATGNIGITAMDLVSIATSIDASAGTVTISNQPLPSPGETGISLITGTGLNITQAELTSISAAELVLQSANTVYLGAELDLPGFTVPLTIDAAIFSQLSLSMVRRQLASS